MPWNMRSQPISSDKFELISCKPRCPWIHVHESAACPIRTMAAPGHGGRRRHGTWPRWCHVEATNYFWQNQASLINNRWNIKRVHYIIIIGQPIKSGVFYFVLGFQLVTWQVYCSMMHNSTRCQHGKWKIQTLFKYSCVCVKNTKLPWYQVNLHAHKTPVKWPMIHFSTLLFLSLLLCDCYCCYFFFSLSEEIRLFDLINVQQWTPAYTDLIWFIYLIIYILSLYEILLCACTFVKLFSWSINPAKETRFVVYILQKSDNTPVSLSKTISVPVGYSVGKCSERNLPWVVACRVPPTHNHQPCSIIRHAAVGRLLFWQDKSALSACCLSRLAAQQVYGVLRSWLFPFGSADYILVNWPDF